MESHRNPDLKAQLAASFEWWRDAGVDCDFIDAPRQWIAVSEEVAEKSVVISPEVKVAPPPPPPSLALPEDFASFAPWWLTEPALDGGQTGQRVPPRGVRHAEVMLLVPEPEREDGEVLLSGPQGRLLEAMLAAMGIDPDATYLASALPRHTPMADWDAVRASGMGEVLCRHVALAAPKCLIVLGGNILPLLGNDLPNKPDVSRQFKHGDLTVPILATRELSAMVERPRWKAAFWQSWLEWPAGAPWRM